MKEEERSLTFIGNYTLIMAIPRVVFVSLIEESFIIKNIIYLVGSKVILGSCFLAQRSNSTTFSSHISTEARVLKIIRVIMMEIEGGMTGNRNSSVFTEQILEFNVDGIKYEETWWYPGLSSIIGDGE